MKAKDTIQTAVDAREEIDGAVYKGWDFYDYFGTIRCYGWWLKQTGYTLAHFLGENQREALQAVSLLEA